MEKKQGYYIIVFRSYNQSTFLYKKLVQKGCKIEMISTPCRIGGGCSQSIRFEEEDKQCVKEELRNVKVDIKGVYKVVRE